ncbi:MAG: carbohydrate kinase family protein [Candidatus Competibacteraceae bacterium]|nr:carbohydrate kinase family protein [Candidatus Competibacteraceae bacterium]
MTAIICGSLAYDTIMVFQDRFKNHILPDKVHMLNVSFLVPQMRREFGGCAGNIAYNLRLLGGDGRPLGTVGQDFGPYRRWLEDKGIGGDHIRVVDDSYTAQAFITSDLDDNQITAFHPGAMAFSHQVAVPEEATLGIIAPDGLEGMVTHARQFQEAGIPFIFDPGQAMPLLDGERLKVFIDQAHWVAANDYECELILERTGWSREEIAGRVQALIVTRGREGSRIYTPEGVIDIPAAQARRVTDPTGCGDAYRAGLIYGLMNQLDWETTGRIASLAGALKIECHGTQNHSFTPDEFKDRFGDSFGYEF